MAPTWRRSPPRLIMAGRLDGQRVVRGQQPPDRSSHEASNWLPCELPGTLVPRDHRRAPLLLLRRLINANSRILPKPDAKEAHRPAEGPGLVKKNGQCSPATPKEVAHTVADAHGAWTKYHPPPASCLPCPTRWPGGRSCWKLQETGKLAFVGDGINDSPRAGPAPTSAYRHGRPGQSDAAIEAGATCCSWTDQPTKYSPAAIHASPAKRCAVVPPRTSSSALAVKAIVPADGRAGQGPHEAGRVSGPVVWHFWAFSIRHAQPVKQKGKK